VPTNQDITWFRTQTEEWTLTILQADGTPDDLTDAASVEFEVKKFEGLADPPDLHLDQSSGITIRAQSGSNLGVCDLVASDTQTSALKAGTWRYDVYVTRTDTVRKRAMYGHLFVAETVNLL